MKRVALICVLTSMMWPLAADAELSKADKKEIKKALSGTLYMRMDAPCATGRHAYGTYKRPLVEISPEGSETDAETEINASWFHADSTYWGIRINDPVELDEFDIEADEATVEIELEGVERAEDESTVIKFVDIHNMDDFNAAFDQAFARTPLQDEHDDWSDEIKQAIADRELLDGMTKRQAFYITGAPESFEKMDEDGKSVEIWTVRTDRGMKMGFFTLKKKTDEAVPQTIRFEDGKLVKFGKTKGFSLDD